MEEMRNKKTNREELIEGLFISNDRGFGFVEVEGMDEDFFVAEDYKNGAFHHDTVLIKVFPTSAGKRREAKVVELVSLIYSLVFC